MTTDRTLTHATEPTQPTDPADTFETAAMRLERTYAAAFRPSQPPMDCYTERAERMAALTSTRSPLERVLANATQPSEVLARLAALEADPDHRSVASVLRRAQTDATGETESLTARVLRAEESVAAFIASL